jgi:flagellar FliJ protein
MFMGSSDRLKPVKRLADNRERAAAREFGDAQRALQAEQDKLVQLQAYHREYVERFHEAARSGMSATRMMEFRSFIASLEHAIQQQEQQMGLANADNAEAKATWQYQQSRSKAIGKAVERFQSEERLALDKREQSEQDERNQHLTPVH